MRQYTFGATNYFIVDDSPNWKRGFTTDFSLVRDSQVGLTKHEARRPYSQTLRVNMRYSVVAVDAALRTLQGQLRQLNNQPLAIPFWPAMSTWANRAAQAIKGGLMIVWKADWSQFDLYPAGSEPVWPAAGDYVAPALQGFLQPTQIKMVGPETGVWPVQFVESSSYLYALQVTAPAPSPGPTPTGYGSAPTLLPFEPDFRDVQESLVVDVGRESIGFDRTQQNTFYPHDVYRTQVAQYTLKDAQIAELLVWFRDVAGPGASFWAASAFVATTLSAPCVAADTVLHCDDTGAILAGDFICAIQAGAIVTTAFVNTLTSTQLNLTGTVGAALPAGWTFFNLTLAALDKPTISIDWKSPVLVKAKLNWTEQRPEQLVSGIGDETLGVSIGKLPIRTILFQFTRDYGNGTTVNYYFTSYEITLAFAGQNYIPGFGCGDVAQGLNAEEDSCELTTFMLVGNPALDELTTKSEAPLKVKVWFADVDPVGLTASNAVVVFWGDVDAPSRDGSKITLRCRMGTTVFDTMLPRLTRGINCSHLGGSNDGTFLMSAGCTLLKADFKFTGLVTTPIGNAFPATLKVNTIVGVGTQAAAATVIANYFANGWIEWGTGAGIQRRQIVGSTTITAGVITLTLHRYFGSLPNNGDAVTFYPGCDGLYNTCQAYNVGTNPTGKFNNKVNFGGEPFRPMANPSITAAAPQNIQGGKK